MRATRTEQGDQAAQVGFMAYQENAFGLRLELVESLHQFPDIA